MEPGTTDPASQLLPLLLEDAYQFGASYTLIELEQEYQLQFVVDIYERQATRLSAQPGYPRLYRCAWKLLAQSVAERDWATLQLIFDVQRVVNPETVSWLDCIAGTRELISPWHLKAVLFCWAYLRDDRALGQSEQHDETLLAQRRTQEEAEKWLALVAPLRCFLNMEPREAHQALDGAREDNDYHRPYLFRLSTTLPGLVTVSLLAPLSRRPIDQRLSPQEAQDLVQSADLYAALLRNRLGARHDDVRHKYNVNALVDLMRTMEQARHFDQAHFQQRLQTVMPAQQVEFSLSHSISILKRAFWNRVSSHQLLARTVEECVGLTKSYCASYEAIAVSPNQQQASCFSCHRRPLRQSQTLREPLNGQLYCSEPCYAVDFEQCY
jgi:hypothetical protein